MPRKGLVSLLSCNLIGFPPSLPLLGPWEPTHPRMQGAGHVWQETTVQGFNGLHVDVIRRVIHVMSGRMNSRIQNNRSQINRPDLERMSRVA